QTPEFVFLSNRPVLAALALSWGATNGLSLSREYLTEYLLYGYSISGQTPYEGVETIPVDMAICIVEGQISFTGIPEGLTAALGKQHSLEEGGLALAEALKNAMTRSAKAIPSQNLQLRLSGGKDSRLLLGLLRNTNLNVRAVTFGRVDDAEVVLARHIADLCGVSHQITSPSEAVGEGLAEQTD